MSNATPYARISLTLPVEVLAHADRLAKQWDRSRSWVIADAIRHYAGGTISSPASARAPTADEANLPPEVATPSPITPDRLAALLTDMALPVEDRVRASESAAAATGGDSEEQLRLLAFHRAEGYSAWRRRAGTGP